MSEVAIDTFLPIVANNFIRMTLVYLLCNKNGCIQPFFNSLVLLQRVCCDVGIYECSAVVDVCQQQATFTHDIV